MKRIYTFGHEQVERNITVGDIISNKNNNIKVTQVTAANQEEAEIIASQEIDMIITGSDWYQDVRKGAPNTFITAALFAGRFITHEEILRGAFDVMMAGADSVLTPRSFDVVEMLAKEGIQVQGHVGMVPSMATKYGGIRTVGKTADEAISILNDMKRLEDAGAFGAEVECVAEDALIEIKSEIDEVINDEVDRENNVLKNAPHTLEMALNDNWDLPYTREKAVFPLSHLKQNKFWPTVRRINGALEIEI